MYKEYKKVEKMMISDLVLITNVFSHMVRRTPRETKVGTSRVKSKVFVCSSKESLGLVF